MELARLQEQLDNLGLWQLDSRINEVIEQLGLDANAQLASLSGGWLRKSGAGPRPGQWAARAAAG